MTRKPFAPTEFGRYLLTQRLAVGGMAEIFVAKIIGAMGFEKQVVIKRILPQLASDAEFLRMFVNEAKLVCNLEHPNIVQVIELGELSGQYFIAMEYVNGIDARQMWRTLAKRKQRLPGVLALFVVSEMLKGLDYAHRAQNAANEVIGVVHRDVSPSNILLSYRGDVKIGDFGIALVQQESRTQAGVLKGKYGYMSPEQVAGLRVDHRSDIFSAGIVLAELVLGRRLFLGRSDFDTLDRVMNVRLAVLQRYEHAIPAEITRIIRRALQRDPEDRFQSARQFHDAIIEFLYERRERVTHEALAAFIADHVAPHVLPRTSGEDPPAPTADHVALPLLPTEQTGIAGHGADAEAGRAATTAANLADVVYRDHTPTPATIGPGEPQPIVPLWDNLIDPEQQRAGAIRDFELDDVSGQIPSLDLQLARTPAHPTASFLNSSTVFDGVGEELDLSEDDDSLSLSFDEASAGAGGQDEGRLFSRRLPTAEQPAVALSQPDYSGTLTNRTPAKVLWRFSVANESGLLTLSAARTNPRRQALCEWIHEVRRRAGARSTSPSSAVQTCELQLVHGQPQLIAADRSEECLVAFLIDDGQLDKGSVARALASQPHRNITSVLLAAELVAPLQLSREVTRVVTEAVIDSFGWQQGRFTFARRGSCTHEAFLCDRQVTDLIAEGVSRIDQQTMLAYAQRLGSRRVAANPRPPAPISAFAKLPDLLALYQACRDGKPASALLGSGDDRLSRARALYMLVECEIVALDR